MSFQDDFVTIHHGDAWELAPTLAPQSINTIVTSPPYWGLRDYGEPGQFGLEPAPEAYVARLVELFALLRPALRDDGTVWLNLGDSYNANYRGGGVESASDKQLSSAGTVDFMARKAPRTPGTKPKDLIGIPWRVAFALQADGWYLRQDIIWHKPNPMPESVTDRCTKAHEYVFLLSKSPRYYYDADAIKEPLATPPHAPGNKFDPAMVAGPNDRGGSSQWETSMDKTWGSDGMRNKRSVWSVTTQPFTAAHFATFPPALITPCILAGCPEGGTVLDPFMGSGTTAATARSLGRKSVGFELNAEYIEIAAKHRLAQGVMF